MSEPKIPQSGKIVPFEEIGVQPGGWHEYLLADGNTLRIKFILLKVMDTGKVDPTGIPIYTFQTDTVATVFTPEQGYVTKKR